MAARGRAFVACAAACAVAAGVAAGIGGCQAATFIGGAAQNFEYQKQIEVLPKYNGLEGKSFAVIVSADMTTLYENPEMPAQIAAGVTARIERDVPGARKLDPRYVVDWQYRTPQWTTLPYGEIAEHLNVDRVVFVEIFEFRLNPPGNRYEWEGVCAATIGIVERDGIDPDMFASTHDVVSRYPTVSGVAREDAPEQAIRYALLSDFVKRTAWLFHTHLEPKYPDKYRPELDT